MANFIAPFSGTTTHKSVNPSKLNLTTSTDGTIEYDGSSEISVDIAAQNVTSANFANEAESAKWLMNRGTNVTVSDSSWAHGQTGAGGTNTTNGTVWKQRWTQSGLTYTPSGGSATTLTDSGDMILWLSQNTTSNNLWVNMAIDGYIYSHSGFKGPMFAITGASSITANIAAGTSSTLLSLTNSRPAANISANNWFWGLKYLVSNMIANTNACHVYGKATSSKNSGVLNYHHAGDASNDNYTGLGIYAVEDILKVYADKRVSIAQNLQIPAQSAGYTYGIQFMSGTTKKGSVGCDTNGAMCIYSASKLALRPILDAATDGVEITTTSVIPTKNTTMALGGTSNKWTNVYSTALTGGLITIGGSADVASKSIVSSSTLYLTRANNCSIIFTDNGTNKIRIDTANALRPETNNTLSVGTSDYKWASMYATTFYGTLSGNASSATKAGNSAIWLYPESNNEINFGGTDTSTLIYFGYKAKDSRPKITKFIFGEGTGTADLQAKVVYLGSGTSSYVSSTQYTGNAASATKVAAKLAATTKTYILGTSTAITGTAANVDLLGDTGVYLTTTAGQLNATSYLVGETAIIKYNTNNTCLEIIV